VLQCVAVCCSVLQCVAVCCGMLQCVAVFCSVKRCRLFLLTTSKNSPGADQLVRHRDYINVGVQQSGTVTVCWVQQ